MARARTAARNVPLWTAIAATAVALVVAIVEGREWASVPGMAALEGLSIDARFKMRGAREPASDRVVIVAIDDETRRVAPDVIQTRRGYARLIDAIGAAQPRVVAIDLLFSSKEELLPTGLADRVKAMATDEHATGDPEMHAVMGEIAEVLRGDERLAEAIQRNGHVMLGAFFQPGAGNAGGEPPGLKLARVGEAVDGGGGPAVLRPIRAETVHVALPMFARGSIGMGAVNDYRDDDGVRRRMPMVVEYGGRFYMGLGLAAALADMGKPRDVVYVAGEPAIEVAGTHLKLTRGATLPLDVMGRARIPRVSGAAVLAGNERERLAGKLVFVGFTYAESDKVITPLDPLADGVELHATLAENLISGRVLVGTGWLATVLATLVLCGIVCAAQLRRMRRRAWVPPLVAIGAVGGYIALALALFAGGTVVAVAVPVVLTGVVLLAATIGGLATEGREKAHLRSVFSQYVSRPVVDRILADPSRARLGGERKELTVLFSDIRGFSQVAEGMAPEALAAFLGEYLSPMTDLVLASGGTLDKYIGDAIMAIWGAPIDMSDHAARACEVALKMQQALVELNARPGRATIAIGIGINTGAMAVGNMGSTARFEYTVLGDQVNLAARLEALTKEYGVGILVGEATMRAAGDGFVFREIDLVRVKGRVMAAPVFELVGRRGDTVATAFGDALALYRKRDFAAAKRAFEGLAGDSAAEIMAQRCAVLAAAPPGDDWDGVYEQRSK